MISMTVRGGDTYSGESLNEIITREFGPTARFRRNFNPNSPEAGMILTPSVTGAFNIVAVVLSVETVRK